MVAASATTKSNRIGIFFLYIFGYDGQFTEEKKKKKVEGQLTGVVGDKDKERKEMEELERRLDTEFDESIPEQLQEKLKVAQEIARKIESKYAVSAKTYLGLEYENFIRMPEEAYMEKCLHWCEAAQTMLVSEDHPHDHPPGGEEHAQNNPFKTRPELVDSYPRDPVSHSEIDLRKIGRGPMRSPGRLGRGTQKQLNLSFQSSSTT